MLTYLGILEERRDQISDENINEPLKEARKSVNSTEALQGALNEIPKKGQLPAHPLPTGYSWSTLVV